MKPFIYIHSDPRNTDREALKEIMAGIEEEGVLAKISEINDDIERLAFSAVALCTFGCGIGIVGREAAFAVNGSKKFIFHFVNGEQKDFRKLGHNAARFVKKEPLIF